jgi:glycosyltransferase involved in cell wall biosynthesis
VLTELLRQPNPPRALLIGSGAQEFAAAFLRLHPECTNSVLATGTLSDTDLAAHVAACDAMIQPYPDGISSRRTTAMAGLALGVPIVTTTGRLCEGLWRESGAVRLTDVGDYRAMAAQTMDLLRQPGARTELRDAGRALYARRFDLSRTIVALRGADSGKAA